MDGAPSDIRRVKFICGQLGVGDRKGVCISSTWSNWALQTPEPPTHGYMQ